MSRVRVWTPDGATMVGVLPTVGLRFSVEVGGGGSLDFEAHADHIEALDAWDSIAELQISDTGIVWDTAAWYALRPPHVVPRTGRQPVRISGLALLQAFLGETVILPETAAGTMPRGAAEERVLGWPMTTYDPAADPLEPWDRCYNTGRSSSKLPEGFPRGTGAKWISATDATNESERKLFRAWLDLTAQPGPVLLRAHLSSDESATLYVGGEPIIETSSVEYGRDETHLADMVVWPGRWAVAVDTMTDFTHGGDGVDPIVVAIGIVSSADDLIHTWPLVTDAAGWVACRRDDQPPDNDPPGPTPGALLTALLAEAEGRGASGWAMLAHGWTATLDSYGQPWAKSVIPEHQTRYAMDTYGSVLNALAESRHFDVWLDPDLILQAAPEQGEQRAVVLDTAIIRTAQFRPSGGHGTWGAAFTHKGWVSRGGSSGPRREFGLELGTARTVATGVKILAAAVADEGRWDAPVQVLAPPGAVPLVNYWPGDTLTVDYPGLPTQARVLSVAAAAGDGGLTWELELASPEDEVTP